MINFKEVWKQIWFIQWASIDSSNYDWILSALEIIEKEILKQEDLDKTRYDR